jgi:hypothetical protein
MSRLLPETEEEMLNVVGVTKANFDKYGKELLDIIQGYAAAKYGTLLKRINFYSCLSLYYTHTL